MKDVTIKGSMIRRQLVYAGVCLAIAFGLNVYSIIHFDRPWVELVSQLGFVVVIAAVLYIITIVLQTVVYLLKRIINNIP